uniref:Alpha-macroglobulin-like TED domain-containing protein n=1 Tax=Oncorhynchus kisutch TaxID=8019 RepID=A0A8C7L5Z1_ONCKI
VRSQTACDNGVVNVPERGRVDTVTRSLLVKAEGTEKSHTYNWLLCPTGEALTEEVELQLPQNVVDGSARISLSVLGDILGRALNNLDGLLQMPYGCGEQNMALLSPNIYILEYLRNTEQLTPAILEKATKFLTSGYQRQLNYKNADGAYSTFGQGLGNTWLTAFVLRSFGKAQSFIYVDPATMEQSKTWLDRQQGQHGCFRTLGKLLNNRMKGGVTDEVTLTAYITASMLELNMSVTDPVVDHSLSCLKNSTSDLSNTYATALLAYTFTLAGDVETRARLLMNKLVLILVCVCAPQPSGGLLHWSQSSSETSPSLEVEISSYVLLASLSASSRSTSDLGYASRIVRWLVRQQNAYGGFSSTQDTVVALQALALYSTRVFSRGGASTVTVRSPSGDRCLFHVNQNNKLLYQERALQDTEGKYSVEVQGSACASVQVSEYNAYLVFMAKIIQAFDYENQLSIIFLRYHGKELTTNMIIVDLKMLSGFSPDPDSLGRVSCWALYPWRSCLICVLLFKDDGSLFMQYQ